MPDIESLKQISIMKLEFNQGSEERCSLKTGPM